jgi:hypothetical protein
MANLANISLISNIETQKDDIKLITLFLKRTKKWIYENLA